MRQRYCSSVGAARLQLSGGAALLALCVLLSRTATAECSCIWEGSFADVHGKADLIVAGTIQQRKGNATDLEIEETLRGPDYHESVRVWMQTRDYCRPPADEFPEGSRWVMALKRIEAVPEDGFDPGTPNQSFGRVGDFYLSSCGGYWLNYRGEAVTGNLIDAPRWARDPDMTPVMLDLIRSYVNAGSSREALLEASREDPALDDLMLDTKAFLRGDEQLR